MVIGHKKQRDLLLKLKELGRLPHALLFSGISGIGKKRVALDFAMSLNKEKKRALQDIYLIEPKGEEIKIEVVRELIRKLSLSNATDSIKVAIVDEAHLMNEESQSCFLKTLEEPRGDALIILVTEYPEKLFFTILSRMERIKFYPLKKKEVEEYLKKNKMKEEDIEFVSLISDGRIGEAISFLEDPLKIESYKDKKQGIEKILDSKSLLPDSFEYVKENIEKEGAGEILKMMLVYFRNLFLKKAQGNDSVSYPIMKLAEILKNIEKVISAVSSTNVNQKLALEYLLMEIKI